MANVRAIYGDKLIYCDRPYGALEGADGLAIVTEWQEFRNPDFEVMQRLLKRAGHLRRPQPLRPESHAEAGLHVLRASGGAKPDSGSLSGPGSKSKRFFSSRERQRPRVFAIS